MLHPRIVLSIVLCISGNSSAFGEDPIPPEQLDFFESHVRPALIKYCYECHSAEAGESRGGLYLDTRDGMRAGGSTGPLFEGEYPLFVDAITWADSDFEMPPKQKMPDDVIARLLEWVEMGAPDPRERETSFVETEIDIEAIEGRMQTHDWHATILHLLGLDHEKLTYRYAGRDFRLTDVHGTVPAEILA